MVSALVSIAISLGITAASIGISKAWDYSEEKASASGGTTYQKVLSAVNRLFLEAKKKGNSALQKAIRDVENSNALSAITGSPAYTTIVNKVKQEANTRYQKVQAEQQAFDEASGAMQSEAAAYASMSDRYKNSAQGKADLKDLKGRSEQLSQNYERRITQNG